MLLHCLFICIVYHEKSLVILIFIPWYVTFFSLSLAACLCITGFEQSGYNVPLLVSFWFLVSGVHGATWICGFIIFDKFGTILVIINSIFFCPPPFFENDTNILECLRLSHGSLMLSSSSEIFSFCVSFWVFLLLCLQVH